jgi:hypothetical protein
MKRNLNWWSTIHQSTTRTITSHLKSVNTNKTTAFADGTVGPGWGEL